MEYLLNNMERGFLTPSYIFIYLLFSSLIGDKTNRNSGMNQL